MNNDIVFVSYREHNAEINWKTLLLRFPKAKRVDGVKGIYNAYRQAALVAESEYVYIVDADNTIMPTFNFDYNPVHHESSTFIFQAKNPVNNLEYGYGGIKLYRRQELIDVNESQNVTKLDFMSFYDFPVTKKIKFLRIVASITEFNGSEFDSWKAGFRESCKLETFGHFMGLSNEQIKIDLERQHIWMTVGGEKKFGKWVIDGALEGKAYGMKHKKDKNKINLINDYNWLKSCFKSKFTDAFLK